MKTTALASIALFAVVAALGGCGETPRSFAKFSESIAVEVADASRNNDCGRVIAALNRYLSRFESIDREAMRRQVELLDQSERASVLKGWLAAPMAFGPGFGELSFNACDEVQQAEMKELVRRLQSANRL